MNDFNENLINQKMDKAIISYQKDLKVIDASAVSLARENNIPIIISSIFENGNLLKICKSNEGIYTIVN